jgi:hypothetical protein
MMRVLLSAPLCLHIWLSSCFTCWPEIWIAPCCFLRDDRPGFSKKGVNTLLLEVVLRTRVYYRMKPMFKELD